MAIQPLNEINMPVDEFRLFFEKYKAFMKQEIIPVYLGVGRIDFRAEVKGEGFSIIADTNRQLNDRSRQMLRELTRGFIGGWKAK
jgi:hypothetical protein